jgi:hypothetical protein
VEERRRGGRPHDAERPHRQRDVRRLFTTQATRARAPSALRV